MAGCWRGTGAALLCGLYAVSVGALAKLPPPTPEEVAAQQARSAAQSRNEEEQKQALAAAQDRIARQYLAGQRAKGVSTGAPQAPSGGGVAPASGSAGAGGSAALPDKATRPSGSDGPHGGTSQSAEAHSAPSH